MYGGMYSIALVEESFKSLILIWDMTMGESRSILDKWSWKHDDARSSHRECHS